MRLILLFILISYKVVMAQEGTLERYSAGLDSLSKLIQVNDRASFKKAVFLTENVYLDGKFHEADFDNQILVLSTLVKGFVKANGLKDYRFADSNNTKLNFGIYKILKDTVSILLPNQKIFKTAPFTYDFEDFDGSKEWSNMFVTKLLATHKGNCHSLPYLYKIIADDINASCWLALAPNHAYITNRCKQIGWYNTELTSGCFPVDAWIMASGYLSLKAIQSGIYMDTLSNQQAMALCMLDLAKGYEHKTKDYFDGFILKCCDYSLRYFPLNVQAMLLKAETLKHIYQKQQSRNDATAKATYSAMQALYMKILDLGYREMPDQMYAQWLQSVVKERDKYIDKRVNGTISGNSNAN